MTSPAFWSGTLPSLIVQPASRVSAAVALSGRNPTPSNKARGVRNRARRSSIGWCKVQPTTSHGELTRRMLEMSVFSRPSDGRVAFAAGESGGRLLLPPTGEANNRARCQKARGSRPLQLRSAGMRGAADAYRPASPFYSQLTSAWRCAFRAFHVLILSASLHL
jgi:hypothetical protein